MDYNNYDDDSFIYENIMKKYSLNNEIDYNYHNIYYYDLEIFKIKSNILDTKKLLHQYIIDNYKISISSNKKKLKKFQNLIGYLNNYIYKIVEKRNKYINMIKQEINLGSNFKNNTIIQNSEKNQIIESTDKLVLQENINNTQSEINHEDYLNDFFINN